MSLITACSNLAILQGRRVLFHICDANCKRFSSVAVKSVISSGFPRLLERPRFFLENSRTWKVL